MKNFFKKLHSKLMASRWVSSPKHSRAVIFIGILLVALVIFQTGVAVGYHKASFGDRMGKAYYRAFDKEYQNGKKDFKRMRGERIPAGFGAAGKVVKIEESQIVIEEKDNTEKFVEITDQTIIRKFKDQVTKTDLQVNDFVVVIGEPNTEGVVVAKLIRLLPPPPESNTTR